MKKRMIVIASVVAAFGIAVLIAGCSSQPSVPFEPTSLMDCHDGYWVTKMDALWCNS